MSTITAILKPDADGTLHLPIPPELWYQAIRVKAELEPVSEVANAEAPAAEGTPLEAFKALRAMGGLRHVIPDPVAWQREQRMDRPLPGRD
jgi:hypothetical protein